MEEKNTTSGLSSSDKRYKDRIDNDRQIEPKVKAVEERDQIDEGYNFEPHMIEGLSALSLISGHPSIEEVNGLVVDAIRVLKKNAKEKDAATHFDEFKESFIKSADFLRPFSTFSRDQKAFKESDFKTDLVFLSSHESQEEIRNHLKEYSLWVHLDEPIRLRGKAYLGTGLIDHLVAGQEESESIRLLIIHLIAGAGVMSATPALIETLSLTENTENTSNLVIASAFSKSIHAIITSGVIEEGIKKIGVDRQDLKSELAAIVSLSLIFAAINRLSIALKMPGLSKKILSKSIQEMERDVLESGSVINLLAALLFKELPNVNAAPLSKKSRGHKKGALEKKIEEVLLQEGIEKAPQIAATAARETLKFASQFTDEDIFRKILHAELYRTLIDIEPPRHDLEMLVPITWQIRKEILQEDLKFVLIESGISSNNAIVHAGEMADSLFRAPELFKDKEHFTKGVIETLVAYGLVDEYKAQEEISKIDFGLVVFGASLQTLEITGDLKLESIIEEFSKKACQSVKNDSLNAMIDEALEFLFGKSGILQVIKEKLSCLSKTPSLQDFVKAVSNPSLEYFIFLTKATAPALTLLSFNNKNQKREEINRDLNISV